MNGNATGGDRVSTASISLNGSQIAGPSDFNQQVAKIVKPVSLGANNQLTITLASAPGAFITVEIDCASGGVSLTAGNPGDSLSGGLLLAALPIINTGTVAAQNVTASAITLTGGTLVSPGLPDHLGNIAGGGSTVLNADFTGTFVPNANAVLGVSGTYAAGTATYCFALSAGLTIPPASPGQTNVQTVSVNPSTVTGAPFPTQPVAFDDDVNGSSRWTVPVGPFVSGTPTPGTTGFIPAPIGDPPAIDFLANNAVGIISGGYNGSVGTTAEPSGAGPVPANGATGAGVVFTTANWAAAYSTDGGATFHTLDPTTIFPNDVVGFCCDQIVQYVPSINKFVWLLQGNGYRIATASPTDIINSHGTAWTYWNLPPSLFTGFQNESLDTSLDYPDMAVGNNSLYASWDAGVSCKSPCDWGHQVVRISLAQLGAGGTIGIDYTNPGDGQMAWGAKLSQDSLNGVFWAGHNSNSQMRVFSMYEGQGFYSWRDVGVSSWPTSGLSSTTPDAMDWLTKLQDFPGSAVIGSTRTGNGVWFAWTAGTNDFFHQAHIEMVELDTANNFNKLQQVQIWNNGFAFAYPALATNACTNEVGLSLELGGNGGYENHAVGFWGDFLVYVDTNSNVGSTRYGDYVSIRQAPATVANPGNLFDAFGYGLNSVTPSGVRTDLRYVLFGRPPAACHIIG